MLHAIKAAQLVLGDGQGVRCSALCRVASCRDVEFLVQPTDDFAA
jgi:hypothetical protein